MWDVAPRISTPRTQDLLLLGQNCEPIIIPNLDENEVSVSGVRSSTMTTGRMPSSASISPRPVADRQIIKQIQEGEIIYHHNVKNNNNERSTNAYRDHHVNNHNNVEDEYAWYNPLHHLCPKRAHYDRQHEGRPAKITKSNDDCVLITDDSDHTVYQKHKEIIEDVFENINDGAGSLQNNHAFIDIEKTLHIPTVHDNEHQNGNNLRIVMTPASTAVPSGHGCKKRHQNGFREFRPSSIDTSFHSSFSALSLQVKDHDLYRLNAPRNNKCSTIHIDANVNETTLRCESQNDSQQPQNNGTRSTLSPTALQQVQLRSNGFHNVSPRSIVEM